ncbi:putative conserved hypothetical protein [Rosellinia necatrix]|uniref:Cardiolipin synthase N-terminal domain-containing protein n=1 Tax=Rosellinia necatrix TaxID=77044 RepID=A0A1S7ULB1_ROSNE|nr:putative conserved hypothetical protein [Rosellinia necatrix]
MMLHNVFYFLLQLCLATWVFAAPIADDVVDIASKPWHYGAGGGIVGFIVLVLDLIVFIEVLKSNRSTPDKLIWCLVVFLFPIVGMVVYFLFSNRKAHNTYEPLP